MRKILLVLLLILIQNVLQADEPKMPNLIGSWFLHSETVTFIGKEVDDNHSFWHSNVSGFIIKFIDKDMAVISPNPASQIKCFYTISIENETKYSTLSYKIVFVQKDGNNTQLFIKSNGNGYSFIFIQNNPTIIDSVQYSCTIYQGDMNRDSR